MVDEKFITWKQAKYSHKHLKSRWSDESSLTQKCIIAILQQMQEQTAIMSQVGKQIAKLNRTLGNLDELQGVALAFKEQQNKK